MNPELEAALLLRNSLLKAERWFTAAEVAERVDVGSDTPALVEQLRRQRAILAVRLGEDYLYPAFQFTAAPVAVHPAISDLLAALPNEDHGWAAAFWCFSPTLKLGRSRPADVMQSQPDAVVAAARKDFGGDNADW